MADSSITSPLLSEAPRPASPKLAIPEESTPHVSPLIPEPSDPDAADETTPLLASDAAEGSPTATGRSKAFYVLTILSLVFSAATIIFMCLAYLAVLTAALGYQWNYQAEEAIPAAITLAILSIIISAFNVSRLRFDRSPAPLAVNMILDLIISFYTVAYGVMGLSAIISHYDGFCQYNQPADETADCLRRVLPAKVLVALAFGAAVALGIDHLVLFVMRCRAAYLTRFWIRPLHFPTGQFTVEFTVKLLRQTQEERGR